MSVGCCLFRAILLFLSPRKLFVYLKRRYSASQIAILNNTLSLRGKLNNVVLNVKFLRQCLSCGVAPSGIQARVRRAKVYHSLRIEKVFLRDEIARCEQSAAGLRRAFVARFREAKTFLSYTDFIRFARLVAECDEKQRTRLLERNQRNVLLLKKQRYGSFSLSHDTIINLSDKELTDIEKDVLSRGVDFGIPWRPRKEEVLAEFEMFYRKLVQFSPQSMDAAVQCRSSLETIAHEYANKDSDTRAFSLDREHLKALKELRRNEDIVISRPDKGRATVVLNRSDYVLKMKVILQDTSKFKELGPVDTHDKTASHEAALCSFLEDLRCAKEITDELYDAIRPVGSVRPRLYGLPKIHKSGCPLRPILSMTRSPQFAVSQWLCQVLSPVVERYSKYCVKDSFAFVDLLREHPIPSDAHMCSFDVVSLFTNVPLEETIDICVNMLYRNDDVAQVSLTEASFRKLMRMVTSDVEFSFDNVMYRQIDGVAMGSPLGPVLANIFVGYYESLVPETAWPSLYCRFVDDSFACCLDCQQSEQLLYTLNGLHPSLQFTCEHEENKSLPFMDVLVERSEDGKSVTSVYRKPTFTGLYTTWDSFSATRNKINLVKCLVFRAKRICSKSKLQQELDTLASILKKNGYPADLLSKVISTSLREREQEYGPKRCPLYICLPWKGHCFSSMARRIVSTVRTAYFAVNVNVVYSTMRAFNVSKDTLPTQQRSSLIYEFECRGCESRYVGRTLQRLTARIKQHVPLHLLTNNARALRPTRGRPRKDQTSGLSRSVSQSHDRPRRGPPRACKSVAPNDGAKMKRPSTVAIEGDQYQSSIARHLVENAECAEIYDDNAFKVLCYGRSKHHLEVLEAIVIACQKPNLCAQKTMSTLRLFHAPAAV